MPSLSKKVETRHHLYVIITDPETDHNNQIFFFSENLENIDSGAVVHLWK